MDVYKYKDVKQEQHAVYTISKITVNYFRN